MNFISDLLKWLIVRKKQSNGLIKSVIMVLAIVLRLSMVFDCESGRGSSKHLSLVVKILSRVTLVCLRTIGLKQDLKPHLQLTGDFFFLMQRSPTTACDPKS